MKNHRFCNVLVYKETSGMKWVNNETPTYMFIHINSDNSIAVIDYE